MAMAPSVAAATFFGVKLGVCGGDQYRKLSIVYGITVSPSARQFYGTICRL